MTSPSSDLQRTARLDVLVTGSVDDSGPALRVVGTVSLVRDGDRVIVVDPGMVASRADILEPLAALGVRPEDVTDVVLSHHHPDHTVNIALFPEVPVHDFQAAYQRDMWTGQPAEGCSSPRPCSCSRPPATPRRTSPRWSGPPTASRRSPTCGGPAGTGGGPLRAGPRGPAHPARAGPRGGRPGRARATGRASSPGKARRAERVAPGMKVEIWSDVVCPWCYIGKRRFEAALARFPHRDEVELVWRSFELDPGAAAERGAGQLRRPAGRQVRPLRAAGAGDARHDDRDGRRGGARLPLRPRHRRQHLRRPPAAPPRPRARRPGRAQGAAGRARPSPRACRSATTTRCARWPSRSGWTRTRSAGCSRSTATPTRSARTRRRPRPTASAACRSSSSTGSTASPAPSPPRCSCRRSPQAWAETRAAADRRRRLRPGLRGRRLRSVSSGVSAA